MRLYAVAAVETSSSSSSSQRTMVDMHGGAQPFWWIPMNFQIDKSKLRDDRIMDTKLVLCIKCSRSKLLCFNKTVIGKVHLPVKSLLDDYRLNSQGNCPKHAAFMVQSRSGKPRGVIYLTYFFDGDDANTSWPPLSPPVVVPSAPPLPENENNACISNGDCPYCVVCT
ncbi:hypothetical protein ACS0TY_005700 [Phlomoides rotata]